MSKGRGRSESRDRVRLSEASGPGKEDSRERWSDMSMVVGVAGGGPPGARGAPGVGRPIGPEGGAREGFAARSQGGQEGRREEGELQGPRGRVGQHGR